MFVRLYVLRTSVSKGIFKKPDFETGASLFERAGTCFRNAKAYSKAFKAFEGATNAHNANEMSYSAGKCAEQAAAMLAEDKKVDEAAQWYVKASIHYREDGKVDKGSEMLVKAAQALGDTDPDKTMECYKSAKSFRLLHDNVVSCCSN
jgi:tetratricopeptide (TPR) repeat protein